jgi:hypothetical protein
MRPVLSLGRNTVAQSLARRAPLLQSHTKNYSTPAEQGRATASHHNHANHTNHQNHREGVDCGEVWNQLDASHSLPPSRSSEGPPVPSCWPYQAGSRASWNPGHGLCPPSCRALLSWMLRCIFGGAALGRAPCGLGTSCCLQETKALHGTALHLAIAISGFAMRTPVKCGYCCTGKYEYGGAPCYGPFECSGLALWYRSHPLLRVLRLLQALGNTVCSPLSLVAQASPVFTGICGGDHAGDDTSSYGYSRPLIISTDLWGVSNFQQGRDFCKQTAAWVSAHRQPSNGESSFGKTGAWLGFGSFHRYSTI